MHEVPYNKHYQSDVKSVLYFTRIILSALGVWPTSNEKHFTCEKIGKFLRIFVSFTFLLCSIVPGVLSWILKMKTRARIRTSIILWYGFVTLNKYYNLITHENQIGYCIKYLEEDWKNVDNVNARNTMHESARTGKRMVTICAVFFYSSGISFRTLMPLSRGKIITPENVTIRPLPYPTYLFSFNVQVSPIYEMVYAMQFVSGLITMSIGTSVYGLLIIFVSHACGQLKILIDLMNGLVERQQENELEVNRKLAVIVERQIRIRSFLQLVERSLQQIYFLEIGYAVILCILLYCILMEWESSNSMAMCSYFISFTATNVGLFLFCYTGELLITQAEKVAVTSCELEWYRLPNKKARGIVLVMIMSNIPLKITAGKLFVLSLKTYGDILKTSAAYFNMIRTLNN